MDLIHFSQAPRTALDGFLTGIPGEAVLLAKRKHSRGSGSVPIYPTLLNHTVQGNIFDKQQHKPRPSNHPQLVKPTCRLQKGSRETAEVLWHSTPSI